MISTPRQKRGQAVSHRFKLEALSTFRVCAGGSIFHVGGNILCWAHPARRETGGESTNVGGKQHRERDAATGLSGGLPLPEVDEVSVSEFKYQVVLNWRWVGLNCDLACVSLMGLV